MRRFLVVDSMKKIPTMFERNWAGDRSRVVNVPHADCGWVFAGEGVATRKYDGTSCMIRDGVLFKRREVKKGVPVPPDMEVADHDEETGKTVGWVRVGDGPEDRWHREAMDEGGYADGTYELLGPKVQGNVEGRAQHTLQAHNMARTYPEAPRTWDELRVWLADKDIEGLVFHHPDGRMAKIKLRDFGLKRRTPHDPA
jgi:hypothetical protein